MKLWMLAAILTCCVCCCVTAALLTSCSYDKVLESNTDPQPLAEKLSGGAWYTIYEAEGVAQRDDTDGETIPYNVVIDIYHFQEDGTGDFQRCFFNDDRLTPALVQGTLGYGRFSYTTRIDGTVYITLTNDWNQSYPKQWSVFYANDAITAAGVHQQQLTLQRADDETIAALNAIVDQNGSKTKYNVNDYKPLNVDNSQWMKSLSDTRLVADLSLPGSHDACTAQGWKSKLLASLAEGTAKTQDLTISEQLKVGVRVFDLRPERIYEISSYVLRCAHGIMATNMLVSDFFQQHKDFLAANPTEFCILTIDLSATSDKKAWGNDFTALVTSADFQDMFVNFKPRLTVGEMRGHVLMLSRHEYAQQPIGGYCYGWVYDIELEKQTKGHITGPDGVQAPLWVQDYWGKSKRDGKDDAILRMLQAAAARDMTADAPAWVINYPSAYFLLPLSDSYRENAVSANKVTADWLSNHVGSVGIIYMDYAGMDKSPSYSAEKLYDTCGMTLIERIIQQNKK